MTINQITTLFNIGRPITKLDKSNKYLYFAYKYQFNNYRLITSGELNIRGKDLNIPDYVKQFVNLNNEVLMIANIMDDKVVSIIFRTIKGNKEFIKLGTSKSLFYGLGQLDSNFRYGTPVLLVEGNLDRDRMSLIYKNTLAITTASISSSQMQLLSKLTNKFILMLDNDNSGIKGSKSTFYKLREFGQVKILKHDLYLKDAGDLIDLEIKNDYNLNHIIEYYKQQIYNF